MTATRNPPWAVPALIIILAVALIFRLAWVLVIDPNPVLGGGDQTYYLDLGKALAGRGGVADVWFQATAPVYPLFVSLFYRVLPEENVVQGVRVAQAFLETGLCWVAFDLARRLFDVRVGLLASALLALDLRHVVQAGLIQTEGLTTLLLLLSTWAFVVVRAQGGMPVAPYLGVGGLYLLTAFTRAVALPIPALLFGSLVLPKPTRTQLLALGALAAFGLALVGGYAVYNYQRNGTWVVISDGFAGNFWMGSRSDGQWHGLNEFQQEIEELKARYGGRTAYMEDALQTIAADPVRYVQLLGQKVTAAYLQPNGTAVFPGESLKELAAQVLAGRLSLAALVQGDAFWPKLYIYIFHYFGLAGGLAGMWLTRKRWLEVLPATLPIVWFTVIHTLLTIIPRYLFPIMPLYMILACATTVMLADTWRARRAA